MKAKLLKRLRKEAKSEISINSITRCDGAIVGMNIGFSDDCYRGLFEYGNTEEEIYQKVIKIFFLENIDWIRQRYKKYSRKNKKSN